MCFRRNSLPAFALFALSGLILSGAEPVLRTYPLPIDVDGQWVKSSLYIEVRVQDYSESLAGFQSRDKDAEEQVLANLLNAFRTKNYSAAAEALNTVGDPASRDPHNFMGLSLKEVVDIHNEMLGGLATGSMIARISLASHALFILDIPNIRSPRRSGFIVASEGGKLVAKFLDSSTPLDLLVLQIFNGNMVSPFSYRPVANSKSHFRQELIGPGTISKRERPAMLFEGDAVSVNLGQSSSGGPSVVNTMRKAHAVSIAGDLRQLSAFYTPGSGEAIRKWAAGLSDALVREYVKSQQRPLFARFVLNADPVFIVFYSTRSDQSWLADPLHYQYVVRDASGTFRLANFGYSSYLDSILNDPRVFNPSVLQSGPPTSAR